MRNAHNKKIKSRPEVPRSYRTLCKKTHVAKSSVLCYRLLGRIIRIRITRDYFAAEATKWTPNDEVLMLKLQVYQLKAK